MRAARSYLRDESINMTASQLTPVFFILALALQVFGVVVFWIGKDPQLKRKALLPYSIAWAILILVFALVFSGFNNEFLFFGIPIVAVIVVLVNYMGIIVCDECGSTLGSYQPWSQERFCQYCGAKLK